MKRITTTLILICALVAAFAAKKGEVYMFTSFHEPADEGLRFLYSYDGEHWDSIPGTWIAPQVGTQKVMRDPSIQQSPDGTFHFVWTCSWRGDRGFGYASSRDLIHWSEQRFIEAMPDPKTVNVWAPELFWDDLRQEMMIVWASCIPGKFERGMEAINGNYRLYYTCTKDFKTFTPTAVLYDKNFSSIDATLVKRGYHDYVMVVKDNSRPNRNIKISFAKDPHGPWTDASKPFTPVFCEGPSTCQLPNGEYVVYCDRYRMKDYGAYKTPDFVTFRDATSEVTIPEGHKHGTIFKVKPSVLKGLLREAKKRNK